MRHLIVGTAGHIDHGKSALVKALTGTDPDRLKEEKLRGITIDLGFAHLNIGDLQVGFVDVPGHEKFIKNMLAGVGGIDCVLLVVAADESIMPQTREHFEICRLLGITTGIVVITKTDAVDPDLVELVRAEVRDMTRGSFLEDAAIVPASSLTGEGIEDLKSILLGLAPRIPSRSLNRKLRLPIDRVFSVHGFGTVVTGTMTSGVLDRESDVELLPSGRRARVRGIQAYGRTSERAVAGQRTAVNLQGVELSQVERGMVLANPGTFQPTALVDVRLDLLPGARPLKNLVKVRFHLGTSEVLARVALLGIDALEVGKSAFAQLRLDSPTFCLYGDPFIVRQFSPALTIGGGRILNPRPEKHKGTDLAALAAIEKLNGADLLEAVFELISTQPARAVDLGRLNSLLGMADEEIKSLCSSLAAAKRLVVVPAPVPLLLLPETVRSLERETLTVIREFHEQNPLQKGISREELRKRVYDDLPLEVFRFLLDRLAAGQKLTILEESVCLFGREVRLSGREQAIRDKIEALFRNSGCQPPQVSEVAAAVGENAVDVRTIYHLMLKQRTLIRVSDEFAWHHLILTEVKNRIRTRFKPGDKFGVADFKELFGMTRKHAIPLLEHLDREKITRRAGNDRVLL